MKLRRILSMALSRAIIFLVLSQVAWCQAPASKRVQVFGQTIHYLEAGSGPAVILLHGLGGSASNWALTLPALASRFHVYVPDQIGFGESDKPQINYRVATLVDFLSGFYKQLGISKATLVGNSLGGWEAMAFALAYPEKVERLVLVDSAGYAGPPGTRTNLTREALLPLNPSTLAETKQLLGLIFYNQALVTDQAVEQFFAEKLRRNDSPTVNAFIDSIVRGEDLLDDRKLNGINVPTLLLWGREDKLTRLEQGKGSQASIPGARIEVFEACGHVPQMECPGAFNAALLKYLGTSATGQVQP